MLRITYSSSVDGAAKYFEEGLQRGDYYANQEHSMGVWGGKVAERLGLSGEVSKEDFVALSHNRQPDGSKLTPRDHANRRVAYDFTWSVPKSVSVAYAMTGDERIRESFELSVEETMKEIEQEMHTQNGQGKAKHYLKTGEAVWASFTHKTSRPVDGVPDVHLHRHSVLLNATWNEAKNRFQSTEIFPIKQIAPFYEAAFEARLAKRLKDDLGYGIERRMDAKGRVGWEIEGIDDSTLAKFSRRTSLIEKMAKEQKAKYGSLSEKQKAKLGALSREKKLVGQSYKQLQKVWESRLSEQEQKAVRNASTLGANQTEKAISAEEAVSRATDSLFERKSVIETYQLKTLAMQKSMGDVLPKQINEEMKKRSYYQKQIGQRTYLTTEEALQDEQRLLANLREGKGTQKPINPNYAIRNSILTDEQQAAVKHVLQDQNNVTIISGGAGTGKTTLMKEVASGIKAGGKEIYGFAPTAAASKKVMRAEGFKDADTVAQLLHNPKMQEKVKGSVIWVDEAGLIGTKDMLKLQSIAKQQKARLLLSGDSKQHSSILRGDALRLLEKEGGVYVARIHKIQRQRHSHSYKRAVALMAKGKIDAGLHQLDKMGWVKQMENGTQRLAMLANDYADAMKQGKSVLVISPTHIEGQSVSQALRQKLKQEGIIKGKERVFVQLKNTNWTQEQKTDRASYRMADQQLTLEFHQNAKGYGKGERYEIEAETGGTLKVKENVKTESISLSHAKRFSLFRQDHITLAKGDKIRITKGGKTKQGSRIYTGDVFTVKGFNRRGDIKLHTGKTLDQSYGHLAQGLTSTSHSSQGRTVDTVLIAQSSESMPASNQQQIYVSVSRGKMKAVIYTDDKQALEQAVKQKGQRMSAREVAMRSKTRRAYEHDRQIEALEYSKQQDYGRGKAL